MPSSQRDVEAVAYDDAPEAAGRSIVFPPPAAIGAFVLVDAWRGARRAGRGRETAVLLPALLG